MQEQRLIELESKWAHQEDLLERLNRAVSQQELTIFKLEEALAQLAFRFQEIASEKPPHY